MPQFAVTDQNLAESLLYWSATRAERSYNAARIAFCVMVMGRYVALHGLTSVLVTPDHWLAIAILCVPIVFGLFTFHWSAQAPLSRGTLYASVLIDAIACCASLATTVIEAEAGYRGILQTPDLSAVCLLIFATGFRVFPRVVVVGATANILLTVGLVALDLRLNEAAAFRWREGATIELLYVLAASAIAYITVTRTNDLVFAASEKARHAERTQQSMAYLLREQHDTRSLVGALELSAERLAHVALASPEVNADLVQGLRANLRELHHSVVTARDRAYLELTSLDTFQKTNLRLALLTTIERVQPRLQELEINVGPVVDQEVLLRGGQSTLEHVLLNLLVNAKEGNGQHGAHVVHVQAQLIERGTKVKLVVEDDGPGFPPAILARQGEAPATSSKPDSSGLGLWLVQRVIRRSGGNALYQNRSEGGARVTLELLVQPLPGEML